MTYIVHGSRDVETLLQMSLSNQALKLLALMFIERLLVQELHIKPYRGLGSSSPCLTCYKEKDVAKEYVS